MTKRPQKVCQFQKWSKMTQNNQIFTLKKIKSQYNKTYFATFVSFNSILKVNFRSLFHKQFKKT